MKKTEASPLGRLFWTCVAIFGEGFFQIGTLRIRVWIEYLLALWALGLLAILRAHIYLFGWLVGSFVPPKVLTNLMNLPIEQHLIVVCGGASLVFVFFKGIGSYFRKRQFEKVFRMSSLSNGEGQLPRVISIKTVGPYRSRVNIRLNGVGISKLKAKKEEIESALYSRVEEIEPTSKPGFAYLYMCTKALPTRVLYDDVEKSATKPNVFVVGDSLSELVVQDIKQLPHMLIAGTTGSGKSVFIRQVVMSLMENTPHLQLYIIDLKRGLELKAFTVCPNVQMSKSNSEALQMLKVVHAEMLRRFEYLEREGLDYIEPKRDKMDEIVVCIDEASVLFTVSKSDKGRKQMAHEASELTDEIAKQARVAAIHLIMATQKVTKESISTHIQENLEGRMCFKVNTPQGSNMVLSSFQARDLPKTPGRGIWRCGSKLVEVQTPFISKEEIKARCEAIRKCFEAQSRNLNQPMLVGVRPNEQVEKTFGDLDI